MRRDGHYNGVMPSAYGLTLRSTLPVRATLGRLQAMRAALIAGWAAGIAWLHAGLGIPLPLLPMTTVLALMGLFVLATAWRLRQNLPATQFEFLAHLLADLTAFAVLVFFSGGATNPFVSLMLVPVVIAAVSLRSRWTWLLAAVASGYYAFLLVFFQPLAVADPLAATRMHLAGMWFNFLVSAALIAFFVARMHAALRERERALSDLREKQLRDERILALGMQAALAAHELATPLSTIQTTAHELAGEFANDPEIGEDCRLLEKQALACKAILTRIAARAREGRPAPQPLDVWLGSLLDRWQLLRPAVRVERILSGDRRAFVPPDGLEEAVLNVLNNAADAADAPVQFQARCDAEALTLDIADRGPGFSCAASARAGRIEPADDPGHGWGMGLALTRATLERAGGRLTLADREDGGSLVRMVVPWKHVA